MRKHTISFKNAIFGIIVGLRTQPNFRIHILLSLLSLLGGYIFHITEIEWLIIILTIGLGLAIELLNTAIEYAVDLITLERNQLAKYSKDASAGAMLAFSIAAFLVALIIFLPKIWIQLFP